MSILPLDVLIEVFAHLQDPESLQSCTKVSSLFREASCLENTWEGLYKSCYFHCNEQLEQERKLRHQTSWRMLFLERRSIDKHALALLERVVNERVDRYSAARPLYHLGFDVWDILQTKGNCRIPPILATSTHEGHAMSHAMTYNYWAKQFLQGISRAYTVRQWGQVNTSNDITRYVDTYSTISCFRGNSPSLISGLLKSLINECHGYLNVNYSLPRSDVGYDLQLACKHIYEFMRSKGFQACDSQDFHNLLNLFPDQYLTSNKQTIPISLVHVFVALARAVGIHASPVSFPSRVLVHVTSPNEDIDDFFVDPFKPGILTLRDDIPVLLRRHGISPANMMEHITPCGARDMLLRTARNIFSFSQEDRDQQPGARSAGLLAHTIFLVFTGDIRLVMPMFPYIDGPLDCATFLEDALAEVLVNGGHEESARHLQQLCESTLSREAEEAKQVFKRTSANIQYFVGSIFSHRKYDYVGCVYGWDPVCSAEEGWMKRMDVDSLPRGRDQPFYSVFSLDGVPRYVAEDNIRLIDDLALEVISDLCRQVPILAMYFGSVEARTGLKGSVRARFRPSPEVLIAYPDDDEIGERWVDGVE